MNRVALRRSIAVLVLAAFVLVACQMVQPAPITTVTSPNGSNQGVGVIETLTSTLPAAQSTSDSGEPGPTRCNIGFKAEVRQGPSTGVALRGMFDFKVDGSGTLTGTLTQNDQSEINVTGQVTGRAINLVFDLGDEAYIFGVGTALDDITSELCGNLLGGPFVGPKPGDAGDWLAKGGTQPGSCIGNNDW